MFAGVGGERDDGLIWVRGGAADRVFEKRGSRRGGVGVGVEEMGFATQDW